MEQILIIEDDFSLNQGLCRALKQENRQMIPCPNLKTAREQLLCSDPSLVLLDINLPDGSGLDFLREIKTSSPLRPVILLTANDTDMDIVNGLEQGADDYITKPFSMLLLGKRVAALLRRCGKSPELNQIQIGDITVDFGGYTASGQNGPIDLTPKEIDLLKLLVEHKGLVLTRSQILDELWGYDYPIIDRTIDTYIKNLRKKLGLDRIVTVKGVGYKYEEQL